MKTVLFVLLIVVFSLAAGYYALPVLIEKETRGLQSQVHELRERITKVEEENKAAPLRPDADFQSIIRNINALSLKLAALEDSQGKEQSRTDAAIQKQSAAIEDGLKKQTRAVESLSQEVKAKTQKNRLDSLLAAVRGSVLKVKVELLAKNIGTAKNELELISGTLDKAKTSATEENKKVIDDLQGIAKKARAELDNDLSGAMSRIDLLWHELGTLLSRPE